MIFVITEEFPIQLQTTGHLTSYFSRINNDSGRFVFAFECFGHGSLYHFSTWPNINVKLRYIKLIHVIKILLTVEVDTSNK